MSHPQRELGPDKEGFCLQRSLSGRHTKVSIRSGRWVLSQLQTYYSESDTRVQRRGEAKSLRSQKLAWHSSMPTHPKNWPNVMLGINHGSLKSVNI